MASNYPPYQSAVPTCKHHPGEELDYYCFTSKRRICEECCRGDHKDHDWKRSKKAAKEIRENSEARCKKLEKMITGLEHDKDEKADIDRIEKLKIDYISSINDWAESLKAKRCRGDRSKIEIEKLKKMLNFYGKEIHTAKDSVTLEVDEELYENTASLYTRFKEGKFSPDVLQYMFGDVIEIKTESKIKVTERSHFTHVDDSTHIRSIVPVTRYEALVRRYKSTQIDHVDMTGRVIKERELPTGCDDFIMIDNDFIYTHIGNKIIRRISSSGTVSDLHSTAPLHPGGITTSRDGGILVTLCDCYTSDITSSSRGQILHINTKGEVKHSYGHIDDHTDKVLVSPYRVAQNVNMDLCIVDIVDKDGRSRLVVMSVTSKVQFIYKGESSLKEKFDPTDVCCDRHGRIILNCLLNDSVILLSEDGRFIKHLLMAESPLWGPQSLALLEDTLWVGCEKGIVRVYRYIEDGD